MSKRRSLTSRARDVAWYALYERRCQREVRVQPRRLLIECLETRAVLTTYTYPFGASPNDVAEYMLGDVAVNVVLMESDASIAPNDNGTIEQKVTGSTPVTINYTPENWTPSLIAAAKTKVADGLQWWKDTLHTMFPSTSSKLLDFKINWQYADNPVPTGYEPIARTSNDLISDTTTTGPGKGWIYDFLKSVGFDSTGSYTADMRAFNDYTRQQANADWAFTIFVVNDQQDLLEPDGAGEFSHYGSLVKAFSIPGGQFVVTPAGRPTSTYAHEVGHQFWAMDEYFGGSSYTATRGYYNTQNYNSEDNPALAAQNEAQSIAKFDGSVTGGNYALTINLESGASFTTAAIPYTANATAIRNAINAAAGSVSGWNNEITVAGGPLTTTPVTLTFSGSLVRFRNQPLVTINGAGLVGGGTVGAVTEVKPGRVNQQQDSIMSTDHVVAPPNASLSTYALTNSFTNHVLDPYTAATIGWQDSDQDGIFDVLDVPFTLTGSGRYDPVTELYSFRGASHVNTLPNRNSAGTQNDITINQINIIEAKIDNGPWFKVIGSDFPARTYSTDVSIDLHLDPGHTVQFRSADTRTGVKSNVFQGSTTTPTVVPLPGVSGVVYVDQNANGQWDNNETVKSGVSVVVTDANNAPLNLTRVIEPDNYASEQILNLAEPGVTLSVTDLDGTTGDVVARSTSLAPAAGQVFTATDFVASPLPTWTSTQQLKVVFNTTVSTVSLKAYGTSSTTPSFARLDAYAGNGQLLARYSTGALGNGQSETMTVGRDQADIKYVIAYGRLNSEVVLDSLQWGPVTTTTTNDVGAFGFAYLPNGTYHVQVTAPSGFHSTSPASGDRMITVTGGVTSGDVGFGIAADVPPTYPFHNSGPKASDKYNVNKNQDSQVTALDALMIINYINSRPANDNGVIPLTLNPDVIGYIDVIADGICSASDVLAVINYINSGASGEGESGSAGGAATAYSYSAGNSKSEGEGTVVVPKNAAEYYAQRPFHLLSIPGADEPCMCPACMSTRVDAVNAFKISPTSMPAVAGSKAATIPEATVPKATVPKEVELPVGVVDDQGVDSAEDRLSLSRLLTDVKWRLTARASMTGEARKHGWVTMEPTEELESTLDDIAADISLADAVDPAVLPKSCLV